MSQKITEKISSLPPNTPWTSLEFFPPKTAEGMSNLRARLIRMNKTLHPLFVNITWGAGGSTCDKSLELAEFTQRELGITTCLHLTCTNLSRDVIDRVLSRAKEIGVKNILALRGDPPRDEHPTTGEGTLPSPPKQKFNHAIDLVTHIRLHYGGYFCIGVAGYPEGHSDHTHPLTQSVSHDLPFLESKLHAGADFIMTQLFYDVDAYTCFQNLVRGRFPDVVIIPGLMPVQSYQIFARTTKLSHVKAPGWVTDALGEAKGDDERVKTVGVEILTKIVGTLRGNGVRGFHFYTLNLEKVVTQLLQQAELITERDEGRIASREATWDDFPNGRWGDVRSPAYGEIDGYGASLHADFPTALRLWGRPASPADVSEVFERYLNGVIESMPWSEEPLQTETVMIRGVLLKMVEKGWWTVASQPHVVGVESEDAVLGWGPKGGKVHQKAFVEFFLPPNDWRRLEGVLKRERGLTFFAGNKAGRLVCSDGEEVNIVTWGDFPHRGRLTPTMIDKVSFKSWCEEAFDIWGEWKRVFMRGSESARLMDKIREEYWLVNVIMDDVERGDELWEMLLKV
ncbi:methylenetetrahydrofolate reductase 2 [Piedraia hortae CBS 480.64]|uniref:Methylenetetrahydrofolate reductase 2 n=1 Tax=Piedraia hortae CBS 480.64 TaxID=1314780 RepID=A0A6A7BV23_9PEZI|nr:methylenetetrahydrofolate reductase 2 [Piedraia hortae CBS 480.64]